MKEFECTRPQGRYNLSPDFRRSEMVRKILTPLLVAASLTLGAGAVRADSFLYVQDGIFLNARSGPGSHYTAYQRLHPGTRLSVITRMGNWAQIRTPEGAILWVFAPYLINRAPRVVVMQPPIILRPLPPQALGPKPQMNHPQAPMQPGVQNPPRAGEMPNTTPPGFYRPNQMKPQQQRPQQQQQMQPKPQQQMQPRPQQQMQPRPQQQMQPKPQQQMQPRPQQQMQPKPQQQMQLKPQQQMRPKQQPQQNQQQQQPWQPPVNN
ncbi:MAG: SH3 domain-containing protein [Pseudodonghicola sp.]